MKNLSVLLLGMVLLLSGCATKSGFFSPDVLEQQALSYTKKAQIYNSLEIKATIVATYLNPLLKEYDKKDDSIFLISFFIDEDSSDPKKQGLYNQEYKLTLNGNLPQKIEPLKQNDDLIKLLPIKNMWSHYYLVRFEKPASKELHMILESKRFGSATMDFQAKASSF